MNPQEYTPAPQAPAPNLNLPAPGSVPTPQSQPAAQDPGKGLAIASLVLWFLGISPIGLICALISRKKTRLAGLPAATIATVGLILNIISLLLALVVLPLLIITTFGGIQQKARNSKRQVDISSLQVQIEGFYSNKGYYPSLTDINSGSWRATNLNSFDSNALSDPSNPSNTKLAASPASKQYAYQVTDKNGASCESNDTNCAKYTLTATYEGTQNGEKTISKTNLPN